MTITNLLITLDQEAQEAPTTLQEFWGSAHNTEATQPLELSEPFDWLGIPVLIKGLLNNHTN